MDADLDNKISELTNAVYIMSDALQKVADALERQSKEFAEVKAIIERPSKTVVSGKDAKEQDVEFDFSSFYNALLELGKKLDEEKAVSERASHAINDALSELKIRLASMEKTEIQFPKETTQRIEEISKALIAFAKKSDENNQIIQSLLQKAINKETSSVYSTPSIQSDSSLKQVSDSLILLARKMDENNSSLKKAIEEIMNKNSEILSKLSMQLINLNPSSQENAVLLTDLISKFAKESDERNSEIMLKLNELSSKLSQKDDLRSHSSLESLASEIRELKEKTVKSEELLPITEALLRMATHFDEVIQGMKSSFQIQQSSLQTTVPSISSNELSNEITRATAEIEALFVSQIRGIKEQITALDKKISSIPPSPSKEEIEKDIAKKIATGLGEIEKI